MGVVPLDKDSVKPPDEGGGRGCATSIERVRAV